MVTVKDSMATFRFYRPTARQVYLVGDFNQWRAEVMPMRRGEDGYWQATVRLTPGNFRFRYCADGHWYSDFAAFGLEPGPFGWDSVVRVAG